MPGTTDKKTNKTESLPSEEEGAVRRPDMDTETIQSCYCQDAMSTQAFCLSEGNVRVLGRLDTGGH